MFELLALGTLLLFGLLVVGLVGGLLKLVFWLLFLPFRLALKLLALPFLAARPAAEARRSACCSCRCSWCSASSRSWASGWSPLLGLLVPLLPLIVAGLVVWGLVKVFSRPAAATRA